MQKLADMPLFYIKRKTKTEYIYTYSFKTLPTPPYLYHSIYLMIKKFDWRKIVPIYQDSPYNADLQRVKGWQMAVWQGGCSRVSAMFILDICHVYVKCMLWYRYLVFVTALQSLCNSASKPLDLCKQASIINTSKPLYTCRHFVYCYIGA